MAGLQPTQADARIGERLTRARRSAGLTQRDIADAIGVSAAQLQKYENGTNRISASALQVVATRIGVPIAVFFDAPAAVFGGGDLTFAEARDALATAALTFAEARERTIAGIAQSEIA